MRQAGQVDFVSAPARAHERAGSWYRDVLGLPASEYTAGEVEDSGAGHMGFIRDPDGNVVILHRRHAPRG